MSRGRIRLLIVLLAVAIALWIAGVVITPIVQSQPEQVKADNAILTGIPFILIFVGIIIAFIDLIILLATQLNHRVAENVYRPIERLLIAGIVAGVVGMFQPFTPVLYTWGFIVLLVSTIGYIAWSHIVPRTAAVRAEGRSGETAG
jgi:hypothetical protein